MPGRAARRHPLSGTLLRSPLAFLRTDTVTSMSEEAAPARGLRWVLAVIGLAVLGVITLPLAAAVLDRWDENLILPAHLLVMVLAGVLAWLALPGLAKTGSSRSRRAVVGAAVGLVMAFVAVGVFFLLLNGFSGA